MPRPTETRLRDRARALLEAMTTHQRWIYAIPPEPAAEQIAAIVEKAGFQRVAPGDADEPIEWTDADGASSVILFDSEELGVRIVEADGEATTPILAELLEATGFYAQSTLFGTAYEVRDEEASDALATLAHMVVAWDEGWKELFKLHLAAPDADVRQGAVESLVVAVETARTAGPALALLEDAIAREKDADTEEMMRGALALLQGPAAGLVE